MWYLVAAILLAWALVEDWEAVDSSLDSVQTVLQAVSSFLANKWKKKKTSGTDCCWHHGVGFPDCLEGEYG